MGNKRAIKYTTKKRNTNKMKYILSQFNYKQHMYMYMKIHNVQVYSVINTIYNTVCKSTCYIVYRVISALTTL